MTVPQSGQPDKQFDWRKSPAHLALLATFLEPRTPDRQPTKADWPLVLGETPASAIARFKKDAALRACTITETLLHELPKLKASRLRELSKDRLYSTGGTKQEMAQRLAQKVEPTLMLEVRDHYLLRCTDKGAQIAQQFLEEGVKALEKADARTRDAVKGVLVWLLKDAILAGLIGAAAYDLLKSLWPGEEIPMPRPLPTAATPAPAPQPDVATPVPLETPIPRRKPGRRSGGDSMPEMLRIPAGWFLMGSADSDQQAWSDEKPQHRLYLPEYWIGRYPVTNAQFAAFVRSTGYRTSSEKSSSDFTWQHPKGKNSDLSGRDNHPVRYLSWRDALEYCRWLTEATGVKYSLPSEAEWEKAARSADADGRIYPWGNTWDAKRCNTSESGKGDTTPVGHYSPGGDSPYGCADMAGNVWEWTRSLWGKGWDEPEFKYPYNPDDGREKLDAPDNFPRVLRGGSFYDDFRYARCSYRNWYAPLSWYGYFGFRVGVSAPIHL